MGRISKELKGLNDKTKTEEWPVENKDYYVVRVHQGKTAAPGWVFRASTRSGLTKERLIIALSNPKLGALAHMPYYGMWYVYPGAKPNKKWGPVCP